MSKDQPIQQEIDNYLSGRLSAEHLAEFEKRILDEQELQDEVNLTKQVIDGIQGHAFKTMLERIHERNFGPTKPLE